jgi:DHA2 family multidrug resistance protein
MMRQLGGSFGIALITTFMAQQMIVHRADLVSKLDVTNYAVQSRVTGMQQAMIAQGNPPNIALQKAYQLLDYGVMKQASVLSYMDVFLYIGLMFLICVPFVLMVKGNRGQKVDMSATH